MKGALQIKKQKWLTYRRVKPNNLTNNRGKYELKSHINAISHYQLDNIFKIG